MQIPLEDLQTHGVHLRQVLSPRGEESAAAPVVSELVLIAFLDKSLDVRGEVHVHLLPHLLEACLLLQPLLVHMGLEFEVVLFLDRLQLELGWVGHLAVFADEPGPHLASRLQTVHVLVLEVHVPEVQGLGVDPPFDVGVLALHPTRGRTVHPLGLGAVLLGQGLEHQGLHCGLDLVVDFFGVIVPDDCNLILVVATLDHDGGVVV